MWTIESKSSDNSCSVLLWMSSLMTVIVPPCFVIMYLNKSYPKRHSLSRWAITISPRVHCKQESKMVDNPFLLKLIPEAISEIIIYEEYFDWCDLTNSICLVRSSICFLDETRQ